MKPFFLLLLSLNFAATLTETPNKGSFSDLLKLKKSKLIKKATQEELTEEEGQALTKMLDNSVEKLYKTVDVTLEDCVKELFDFFSNFSDIDQLKANCLSLVTKALNICTQEYNCYKALEEIDQWARNVDILNHHQHLMTQAKKQISAYLTKIFNAKFVDHAALKYAKKRFIEAKKQYNKQPASMHDSATVREFMCASSLLLAHQDSRKFFTLTQSQLSHKIIAKQDALFEFAID